MDYFPSLGRFPWKKHGDPLIFLPGHSYGQKSVVDSIPWGYTESDMTEATQYARVHAHTHTHTYTHNHFPCLNIHILNHCFFVCLFYSDSLYFSTSQIFLFFLLSFHTFSGIDIAVLGAISQATYVSDSEHNIFGALRSKING